MAGMDPRLTAANAAFAQGRKGEAIDHIIAALNDGVPGTAEIYGVLLRNLIQLQRYADGLPWGAKAVAEFPKNYNFLNYFGVILRRTGQLTEALKMFDQAIRLKPNDASALVNKGNVYNDLQNGAAAEAIFVKLVRRDPRNSELQRGLGRALWSQRKFDPAAVRLRQATTLDKANLDAWLDLSSLLADSGDFSAGLAVIDAGLQANPDHPRLLHGQMTMLRRLGRGQETLPILRSMEARFGQQAWYHNELGRVLGETGHPATNDHFRRAVELEPGNLTFAAALAESLDRTRTGDEAANIEESYRVLKQGLATGKPDAPLTKVVLEVLTRSADYDATEVLGGFSAICDRFEEIGQHPPLTLMGRIKGQDDRLRLLKAHAHWGDRILDRARRNPISRPATARTGGKIRLGIMSSDLRSHPVAYFAWPLFEHADRDRFEIYCYSWFRGEETPAQSKLASMVDGFRWRPFISDHDAAQMIAEDQLDILFELGGTTHMNKLDVMAWKPARLTASWLGYPHSAGLRNIDHLMVDPFLSPPDKGLLLEQPLVMPKSWIAMSEMAFPDSHVIDPVAPVHRHGGITFGTANNPYKYNPEMLRTWARVLARVPGSRFLFVRPEGASPSFVRNIVARFVAEGIAAERIAFRPVRGLHIPHYNEIDIALDTFPQTGGTTTCEAAWMGVPTVSLTGEALFERLSHSILQNAGLGDLCATTPDDYVEIAVRLADDTARIQSLRTGLREQLRFSPLGQTRQFAADFYDLVARTVR